MADFEIHVVGESMSTAVEVALSAQGYRRDDFRPGDPSIVRPHHLVCGASSRDDLQLKWEKLAALLSASCPHDFRGFAEAEATAREHRAYFAYQPFAPDVEFPLHPLHPEPCPPGAHKAFDVHVVADLDTLDQEFDRVLTGAGFYVVDIRTRRGEMHRCYTVQPMDAGEANRLFEALRVYFTRCGGFRGKMKVERAHAFARFPADADVPPIIRNLLYRA